MNNEHQHRVKVTINGKDHETHRGINTVEHLRQLGKVPPDEILGELRRDHSWISLDDKVSIEIHGDEVFTSYHKDHQHKVAITINHKEYKTHKGINSVEHLRRLGNVSADDIFSQFKDGQFIDLENNAHVDIHGGEIFASHVKSCGSS